jgi:DNA-binding PadR family transcriptional regulator
MISTTDLTGTQLEQLEALLADTTPGGGVYRPPVGRDTGVLHDLEATGLVRWTKDCGYEITDAGRAEVVDRAMDAAASEAFVRCASKHELRESIERLKAVFNDLTNVELRERTLTDIEACQDRLDDLAEGQSETTGRHRLVPVDDRPTQVIPPVQEQTAPMAIAGTLPGVPVIRREQPDHLDLESAERLFAAIKDADTSDDVFDELAAEQTAEWAALENDLGDDRSWWRRKLTPARVLVLSVVTAVVVTWTAAWLVLG